MDINKLNSIAKSLVTPGKGILAADESAGTIKKRFDTIQVESTPGNHRIYRQLLFKTPGVEEFISGVILFDETIRQSSDEGISFPKLLSDKGIIPGIKVDSGAKAMANFPEEKITEGLDGLRERLVEYKSLGAEFTKWRAVITIGEKIPTNTCIESNAEALARFAALSQEANLVPIVEPEVLMDGEHDIKKCEEVTYKTLKSVFIALSRHGIDLTGILLKPNMVVQGKESNSKGSPAEIAESTLRCFKEVVPKEVPGIVFLSGGQSPEEATRYLNEMNRIDNVPWQLGFSFGRALQEPVLKTWTGRNENIKAAQEIFYQRAKMNSLARNGKYFPEAENES
jgi:fructose-bisphosphate aldolase class I